MKYGSALERHSNGPLRFLREEDSSLGDTTGWIGLRNAAPCVTICWPTKYSCNKYREVNSYFVKLDFKQLYRKAVQYLLDHPLNEVEQLVFAEPREAVAHFGTEHTQPPMKSTETESMSEIKPHGMGRPRGGMCTRVPECVLDKLELLLGLQDDHLQVMQFLPLAARPTRVPPRRLHPAVAVVSRPGSVPGHVDGNNGSRSVTKWT